MNNPGIQTSSERMRPLVVGETTFYSSDDCRLTEKDLEKAHEELNESDDKKEKCFLYLMEKLKEDNDVMCHEDDAFFLRYLRFSKFDCKTAYKRVRLFYSVRMNHPELFLLSSDLERLLKMNITNYLPYRDEEGSVLFWMDFKKWHLEDVSLSELLMATTTVCDILSMNPHCQINGVVPLWDCSGITVRHAAQAIQPRTSMLLTKLFQECYPFRVKRMVLINCNALVRRAFSVLRHVLKKKIADRMKFLGSDMQEWHRYINPALLPKQYGGNLEESECNVAQHILDNLPYLEYERSFGMMSQSQDFKFR